MESFLLICLSLKIGHIIQERRFMEALNKKEHEYEVGDIPAEWEGNTIFVW